MDIFSLSAKIKRDDEGFTSGLKKAGEKFGSFVSGVGRVAGVVTKASAAAVGAGAIAIGGLVKQSVDAYGQYEQLVGGMETLFKDSADEIIGYSAEAYKTAGMSANQYMETATQFSASLLKSLDGDTAKAAKYADKAIRQMSDNVNKMGTSVEMVQNAYRGFARGNFTMLDNLSLGYAGTKEGMEELLAKAEELSEQQGEYRDFSIESYADIVDAIGLVQDEMGITGTTAKEAADTIQGSAGSMKAAWENLVTALGDKNADLGLKVEEFATSVSDMVGNIAPVVRTALESITKVVKEEGPDFVKALPGFILDIVPDIVEAAGSLVGALADGLTQSVSDLASFIKNDDGNGGGGFAGVINGAINFVATSIPDMLNAGLDLFSALLNDDNLTGIINNIFKAIPDLISGIVGDESKGTGLLGHKHEMVQGAIDLFNQLVSNVPKIIESLAVNLTKLIGGIVGELLDPNNLSQILNTGIRLGAEMLKGIGQGLRGVGTEVNNWFREFLTPGYREFGAHMVDAEYDPNIPTVQNPMTTGGDLAEAIRANPYMLTALQEGLTADPNMPIKGLNPTAANIIINAPNVTAPEVVDEIVRALNQGY